MPKKSIPLLSLIGVELFLAVLGIPTGILLISDPSGNALGMNFLLDKIPIISDFTVVGIWLFVVFGLFPVVIAYGLWKGHSWSLFGALFLGIIEIVWIVVQLALLYSVGFIIWQAIIPIMAAFAIIAFFIPGVRTHFPHWQGRSQTRSGGA